MSCNDYHAHSASSGNFTIGGDTHAPNVQVSCNYSGCSGCCPICDPPRCPCCGRVLGYYSRPYWQYIPDPWPNYPYYTTCGSTSDGHFATYGDTTFRWKSNV